MHRYEFVSVDPKKGISIDSDMLASIGIRPGCECWGILMDGNRGGLLPPILYSVDVPDFDPRSQATHLLLSAIHPDLWPSSARLTIQHTDRSGAAADVLEIVARYANVQLYDIVPVGYKHSELRMIINSPNLSSWAIGEVNKVHVKAQETLKNGSYGKSNDRERVLLNAEREKVLSSIGSLMTGWLSCIVANLLLVDVLAESDAKILSQRFVSLGSTPWFASRKQVCQTKKILDKLHNIGALPSAHKTPSSTQGETESQASPRERVSGLFKLLDLELAENPYQIPDSEASTRGIFNRVIGSGANTDGTESEFLSAHISWREAHFVRTWADNWLPAVRTLTLTHLAYASLWRHPQSPIFPLAYDANACKDGYKDGYKDGCKDKRVYCHTNDNTKNRLDPLLRTYEAIQESLRERENANKSFEGVDIPAEPEFAHVVVDSNGCWLRCRFLQNGFVTNYGVQMDVTLEILQRKSGKDGFVATQTPGLLAIVTRAIAENGADIRMSRNENTPPKDDNRKITKLSFLCAISRNDAVVVGSQQNAGGPEAYREHLRTHWENIIKEAISKYKKSWQPYQKSEKECPLIATEVEVGEWKIMPKTPESL